MLQEITQLAGKIEGTEGVAETLAAVDAKVLAINPSIEFDVEMKDRPVAIPSFSQLPQIPGKRTGQASFTIELKGSGVAATAPEWAKFLQACGVGVSALKQISIGAITGGPFKHGETITGGTSAGKGRVIINTATGTTVIFYVVISGTITTGEVITGSISGATATTSSAATTIGNVFEPIHTSIPSLTIATNMDGLKRTLRGARGGAKLIFKTGEPATMEFNFSGVEGGVVDAALFTGVVPETANPPAFQGGTLLVDTLAALAGGVDINIDNTLAQREDPSDARGVKSYAITGRKTTGSVDPELPTVAAYDIFGKWFAGTQAVLDLTIGSVAGNKFRFFAPFVQYTKVGNESRNGIAVAKGSFALNGTAQVGNDEWALLSI